MATDSTVHTERPELHTMSASGACLRSVTVARALTFLDQVADRIDPGHRQAQAWGAFEDRTTLIGAGVLIRGAQTSFSVYVAVVPERRHLGIGGELLDIIIREASAGGGRTLMESTGLTWARRVDGDRADAVLSVPSAEPVPGDEP